MNENNKLENSFKIYSDDEDRLVILYKIALGSNQEVVKQTEMIKTKILEYFNSNKGKKIKIIMDLSGVGNKIKYLPKKAKSIYHELSKNEQLSAAAVIGPKNMTSIVFKLVMATIYYTWKINYFYNKKTAIEWLDNIA